MMSLFYFILVLFSPENIFSVILEREEGGKRNISAREKH